MTIPATFCKCSHMRSGFNVMLRHSLSTLPPSPSFDGCLRLSNLFIPTIVQPKNASQNKLCKSQKLMMEKGLIKPAGPGAYHILPFAMRAVEKLIELIDEQMSSVGAQKMNMPTLGAATLWKKSGRWDLMDTELFKLQDRHNVPHCLSPTHEEAITSLIAEDINLSYRNLPLKLYQISQKFRDERRPRLGLLRTREFLMKDLYTFDVDVEGALSTYDAVCEVYARLFDKLQVDFVKVKGSSGAIGGNLSHEFHLLSSLGEDDIYTCSDCGYGANMETLKNGKAECAVNKPIEDCAIKLKKGIEVGHAFFLGKKYSEVFKAKFRNQQQQAQFAEMGCYGLGVSRIIAGTIEALSMDSEIRWPSVIAPYQICIILPKEGSKEESKMNDCLALYKKLVNEIKQLNGEVLLDDRQHMTIGKRLNINRGLGIPMLIVCGREILQDEANFEVQLVNTNEKQFMSLNEVVSKAWQLYGDRVC